MLLTKYLFQSRINSSFSGGPINLKNSIAIILVIFKLTGHLQASCGSPATFGYLTVGANDLVIGSGVIALSRYNLTAQSNLDNLAAYFTVVDGGQAQAVVYSDSSNYPGTLLGQSVTITPAIGWNTFPFAPAKNLAVGTYWIGYQVSSGGIQGKWDLGGMYDGFAISATWSLPPNPMTCCNGTLGSRISVYANVCPGPAYSPTATPSQSITPTFFPSPTPTTTTTPFGTPTTSPTMTRTPYIVPSCSGWNYSPFVYSYYAGRQAAVASDSSVYYVGSKSGFLIKSISETGFQQWENTFGSGTGQCLKIGADGFIYAGGSLNTRLAVMKVSTSGSQSWSYNLPPSGNNSSADEIVIDSAGNVISAGSLGNGGNNDVIIVKLDANGTLLWSKVVDLGGVDYATGVAVDSADNIYVSAKGGGATTVLKYTANGTLTFTFSNSGVGDRAEGVTVDPGGNIFVAWGSGSNLYVSKYDAGWVPIWTFPLPPKYNYYGKFTHLAWTPFGIGVSGLYWVWDQNAFAFVLSSGGEPTWANELSTTRSEFIYSIDLQAGGNVYLSGDSTDAWGTYREYVEKFKLCASTPTPTKTFTASPTRSQTTTSTSTRTASATKTVTQTPTISPTFSESPTKTQSPTLVPTSPRPAPRSGKVFTYPNPAFAGSKVTVIFEPIAAATIGIYDWAGHFVLNLNENDISANQGFAIWDGRDAQGNLLATGIYFLLVKSKEGILKTKFSVVRK